MNHHSQITVVVLLELNKMISASQRTDLVISCLQLSQKLRILLIPVHFLKGAVHGIAGHHGLMVCKSHGHVAHDIAYDSLDEGTVARDNLSDVSHPDVGLRISHAAADVHAHSIGNDHAVRRNDASNGHSLSGVCIRHQTHPLVKEGKL